MKPTTRLDTDLIRRYTASGLWQGNLIDDYLAAPRPPRRRGSRSWIGAVPGPTVT